MMAFTPEEQAFGAAMQAQPDAATQLSVMGSFVLGLGSSIVPDDGSFPDRLEIYKLRQNSTWFEEQKVGAFNVVGKIAGSLEPFFSRPIDYTAPVLARANANVLRNIWVDMTYTREWLTQATEAAFTDAHVRELYIQAVLSTFPQTPA